MCVCVCVCVCVWLCVCVFFDHLRQVRDSASALLVKTEPNELAMSRAQQRQLEGLVRDLLLDKRLLEQALLQYQDLLQNG